VKQENLIQLAKELVALHQQGKVNLYTWANGKELVEWFLIGDLDKVMLETVVLDV
jgi:hypothetical protein